MKDRVDESIDVRNSPFTRRQVLGGIGAACLLPTILTSASATVKPAVAATTFTGLGSPVSPIPRTGHTAVVLNDGCILVAGGQNVGILADVQLYADGTWYALPPMNTPRTNHAAVVLQSGIVMVFGGLYYGPLGEVEQFDPTSQSPTWITVAPMGMPRYGHATSLTDGSILITGGTYFGPLGSTEVYTLL